MASWLEGNGVVGEDAQASGMRGLSSEAKWRTSVSFTKSGQRLESVSQSGVSVPVSSRSWKQDDMKHLNWAEEKKSWTVVQWSKVFFSDANNFCISFGKQGFRVWRKSGKAQNPSCSTEFPQSAMIWRTVSSVAVGPLCFIESRVNPAISQEILEHFVLPPADKPYGGAGFLFEQGLAPAYSAVLDWAADGPDPNPTEDLCALSRGRWGIRSNNTDEPLDAIKASEASITPQREETVVHAKGALTKYWGHLGIKVQSKHSSSV